MEFRILVFQENEGEDFHLYTLKLRTALNRKVISAANTERQVESKLNQKTLAIIISFLEDNPLRMVQICTTAKEVSEPARSLRR